MHPAERSPTRLPARLRVWLSSGLCFGCRALRVAIALVVGDSQVLMVCRRSEDPTAMGWQFPAGVVKPWSSAQITAERAALAETGIRCSARDHLGSRLHSATQVQCDCFLCEYLTDEVENRDPVENVAVTYHAPPG